MKNTLLILLLLVGVVSAAKRQMQRQRNRTIKLKVEQKNNIIAPLLVAQGILGGGALYASHRIIKDMQKRHQLDNDRAITEIRKDQHVALENLILRCKRLEEELAAVKSEYNALKAFMHREIQTSQKVVRDIQRENTAIQEKFPNTEEFTRLLEWLQDAEDENRKYRMASQEQIDHLLVQNSLLKELKTPRANAIEVKTL